MSSRRVYLSKSRLMSARQCLKRLYLEVNRPELVVYSPATEAAFKTGNAIGDIAHQVYGNEDAVVIPYEGGMPHALKKTARLVGAELGANPCSRRVRHFTGPTRIDEVVDRLDAIDAYHEGF